VLVGDRYNAYNRAPVAVQYGYAQRLRDVPDREKEFATQEEASTCTATLCPLLAAARHLRRQAITAAEYDERARQSKAQLVLRTESAALHPGLRKLQALFHDQAERLYHWVESRQVPAANNRAERE